MILCSELFWYSADSLAPSAPVCQWHADSAICADLIWPEWDTDAVKYRKSELSERWWTLGYVNVHYHLNVRDLFIYLQYFERN